jgi:hypothetical protein
MDNQKSNLDRSLMFLGVVILLAIVVYVLFNIRKPDALQTGNLNIPKTDHSRSSEINKDGVSSYTFDKYHFSFSAPDGWLIKKIDDNTAQVVFSGCKDNQKCDKAPIVISGANSPQNQTLSQIMERMPQKIRDNTKFDSFTVPNTDSLKLTNTSSVNLNKVSQYYIKPNGKDYTILISASGNDQIVQAIALSLKF